MCHCHQNIDDNDDDDVVAAVVDDLDESQLPCENSVQDIKDHAALVQQIRHLNSCLLYTSPSPRDGLLSRMPSSA